MCAFIFLEVYHQCKFLEWRLLGEKRTWIFFSAFAKFPFIKVQKLTFPSAKYVSHNLASRVGYLFSHFGHLLREKCTPSVVLICIYCFTRLKSFHMFKGTVNTSPLVQCWTVVESVGIFNYSFWEISPYLVSCML